MGVSAVCPVSNSRATGLSRDSHRMPRMSRETAILLLGDQLSWSHPALQQADPETTVVILAEVREEASYVRHNRHKIALLFSAMRHFAEALKSAAIRWLITPMRSLSRRCSRPASGHRSNGAMSGY